MERYYKRLYSVKEFYTFLYEFARSVKDLKNAKKNKLIDNHFFERIMLAVTEVNGCELCTYYHTELALKQGMSESEISILLSGNIEEVPEEESVAIFFAQHYADNKAMPSKEACKRLVKTYGKEKALAILGVIRAIMVGNVYGTAISAFKSRLKGKRISKSSLGYELAMILSLIPFIPIVILELIIMGKRKPMIRFKR